MYGCACVLCIEFLLLLSLSHNIRSVSNYYRARTRNTRPPVDIHMGNEVWEAVSCLADLVDVNKCWISHRRQSKKKKLCQPGATWLLSQHETLCCASHNTCKHQYKTTPSYSPQADRSTETYERLHAAYKKQPQAPSTMLTNERARMR